MILHTSGSGGTQWPARLAYSAAAIFSAASGITNLHYGFSKGSDLASSLVWAGVAGAVAVVFALSWPAMIRSIDAKRWSAAVVALVALVLSGSYSITAALGSAAGGRTNAATAEAATADARKKAQATYDRAEAELSKLPTARPVAEIEALLMGAQWWKPPRGCTADKAAQRVTCPAMEAELARSRQRDKLKGEMDQAADELKTIQPAKIANSDAKALARYLSAVGVEMTADRLNDLLVLLAVIVIEAGGGLSLVLGMALSEKPLSNQSVQTTPAHSTGQRIKETSAGSEEADGAHTVHSPAQSTRDRLFAMVRDANGALRTGHRALGQALGVSATRAGQLLKELAADGAIRVRAGKTGSVITLVPRLVGA